MPVLDRAYSLISDIPQLVALGTGRSTLYNVEREGVVIRPLTETRDLMGRVSFKAINPEFLLKHDH